MKMRPTRGLKAHTKKDGIVWSADIDSVRLECTLSTSTPRFLEVDVREKDVQRGEERPIEGVESRVETLIDYMYVNDGENIGP